MEEKQATLSNSRPDIPLIVVPFLVIGGISATFFIWPESATNTITLIRNFLNAWFSPWVCLVGLTGFVISIYLAASPLGKIRLGDPKKAISGFRWGAMVFTSTMAADIVFYGLCEWSFYAEEPYLGTLGSVQDWAPTFPLFHWGPIAWSFYLVLAAAFGFMLHVRGRRSRRLSEACRPLLGDRVDGFWGKLLDLLSIFAVIAGTASAFAVSVPLLSGAIGHLFGFTAGTGTAIVLLLAICAIYSLVAWLGMDAISRLSAMCVWLFLALVAYVFFVGGRPIYILETAITSIGNMVQNFVGLSTQLDPLRTTSFPQNWTLFYWYYWIGWCVGAPFFIGQISAGRTVRQVVVEGYAWGLAGTWISFIVLGNYCMSLQMIDGMPLSQNIAAGEPIAAQMLNALGMIPGQKLVFALLAIIMIAFYCTTLDTLTMVSAAYCCRSLAPDDLPDRKIRLFWAILLIVLPVALLFAEGSYNNMQSVAIIAALPISVVLILCTVSFIKDGRHYLKEEKDA